MPLLHCRDCGADINSDTRLTKCKHCGTLFPFACQVCGKPLRPPFAVYSDERHLTKNNEPLCDDHYERQCPDCKSWFRADENPDYFRCPACTGRRAAGEPVAVAAVDDDDESEEEEETPRRRRRAAKSGLGCMVVGPLALLGIGVIPLGLALGAILRYLRN